MSHETANPNRADSEGPSRTEFEVLRRDVQWVKYLAAAGAGGSVVSAALNLGAAPVPSAVAGGVAFVAGLFR